jgi:anti-sigma factor RsiW
MSQFEEFEERPAACAVCETMLPEAVDGLLSETEQRAFNKHVAGCVECARELAEAKRGAAWLSLLKSQAPEPPAGLLARILAETTGAVQHESSPVQQEPSAVAAPAA